MMVEINHNTKTAILRSGYVGRQAQIDDKTGKCDEAPTPPAPAEIELTSSKVWTWKS